jgi:hypothetical protein
MMDESLGRKCVVEVGDVVEEVKFLLLAEARKRVTDSLSTGLFSHGSPHARSMPVPVHGLLHTTMWETIFRTSEGILPWI